MSGAPESGTGTPGVSPQPQPQGLTGSGGGFGGRPTTPPVFGNQLGILGGIPPNAISNTQQEFQNKVGHADSVRGFKVAENESPMPLDRLFYSFAFYDNVNGSINKRLETAIDRINAFRSTFGIEKTFFEGAASLEFRLPINTLEVDANTNELKNTSTATGDLLTTLKYAPYRDKNGNIISFGVRISAPTGSTDFGGTGLFTGFHDCTIQPFVGYIYNMGKVFVQGFSAIEVPFDTNDATIVYNDIGVGYRLYQADANDYRLLTGVVPTVELHVDTPLNHQGIFSDLGDPAGYDDVVSITTGVTFLLGKNSSLGLGVVVPITGPKPYDWEAQVQLNWKYGDWLRSHFKGNCE